MLLFFYLYTHILASVVRYCCESFCCKLSLSSTIIWYSSSNQLFHCDLSSFPIIFPAASYNFSFLFSSFLSFSFSFWILFHISFVSSTYYNRVFCTFVVTFLMNSSFTSFLLRLPISHFFISLFLVFSFLLIFNHVLVLTKSGLIPFQCLSYFHITNIHAAFSFNQHDLSGYIFCCQGTSRWHYACPCIYNHVPITAKSLPNAEFSICFPLSFVLLLRLCPPHCRT